MITWLVGGLINSWDSLEGSQCHSCTSSDVTSCAEGKCHNCVNVRPSGILAKTLWFYQPRPPPATRKSPLPTGGCQEGPGNLFPTLIPDLQPSDRLEWGGHCGICAPCFASFFLCEPRFFVPRDFQDFLGAVTTQTLNLRLFSLKKNKSSGFNYLPTCVQPLF